MAFKLETQKLIPGGLNLLAPGDQVAPGDCLNLDGWWAGAAGKLEQAPNPQTLSIVLDEHSICQASGRTYYGAGRDLYQLGRGFASIDNSYDGAPLGMISYQGSVWIMNRSKQRRDDGTTTFDWTPAAPGKPTLTNPGLTPVSLTIDGTDGYQPDNPNSDGDFTQIKIWISSSIAGLEVGALVTLAGTTVDGTWLVTDIFTGSPNLLYLKANIVSGTLPGTAGTASFVNPGMPLGDYYYWITWVYTEFGESNPSSTTGVVTIAGGSPAAATVNVPAAGTCVKVDIDAGGASLLPAPAGAIGWNIYRQGNALGVPYRLNENVLPLSRTFVLDFGDAIHTHSDQQLRDLGIIMEGDHDAAPAARVIASQVYNGRIVVANSAANPNRIWYTPALQPGFFRGSGNPTDGDWVDIGTDRGDEILFMSVRPGLVVIYRSKSIWRHIGDFGDVNARIECVVPDMGTVGYRSVVSTSLGDYYVWNDGLYKYNGDWGQKVSSKVEPLFLGKPVETIGQVNTARRSECAIGMKNGRIWVSLPFGSSATASLIYHTESQRWFNSGLGYRAFLDTGAQFLGAGPGLSALEDHYANSTALAFQTEYQDCGLPDHEKTWADLVLSHNTHNERMVITIRTNKNAGASDSFVLDPLGFSSITSTKQVIPLVYPAGHPLAVGPDPVPIRAYNLSILINGFTASSGPVTIDTPILLHYYVEARQAKSFDSDETSHGAQGVKEVDQIEFDIEASQGAATAAVLSDIPGGTMATRTGTGLTIAQTTGRQVRRLVLTTPAAGNLLRYKVAPTVATTNFQVYAARARVLPIGVYLDGTVGDFWQPTPISIGV